MDTWTDKSGCHAHDNGWTCNLHAWHTIDGTPCVSTRVVSPTGAHLHAGKSNYACTEEDAAKALKVGRNLLEYIGND